MVVMCCLVFVSTCLFGLVLSRLVQLGASNVSGCVFDWPCQSECDVVCVCTTGLESMTDLCCTGFDALISNSRLPLPTPSPRNWQYYRGRGNVVHPSRPSPAVLYQSSLVVSQIRPLILSHTGLKIHTQYMCELRSWGWGHGHSFPWSQTSAAAG
jgi:hypothetical protein